MGFWPLCSLLQGISRWTPVSVVRQISGFQIRHDCSSRYLLLMENVRVQKEQVSLNHAHLGKSGETFRKQKPPITTSICAKAIANFRRKLLLNTLAPLAIHPILPSQFSVFFKSKSFLHSVKACTYSRLLQNGLCFLRMTHD